MPILIQKAQTSKGTHYVHMHNIGEITGTDAEEMRKLISTGGPLAGLPIIGVVDAAASFSAEARQVFTKTATANTPVVMVVKSAPQRVMLSFVARLSSAAAHTTFFSNETEAIEFVDRFTPDRTPPYPP